jgi:DNA-binding response OmpR family regulator
MNIACYISDSKVSEQIHIALKSAGLDCERLRSEIPLSRLISRRNYDLILVELESNDPDREGIFSWMSCRIEDSTPVMMLSSLRNPSLTATALNAGAEDVVATPVETVELVARIQAILRRTARQSIRRTIELAEFMLDRERQTLAYQNEQIELTPREFAMAWMFFSTPGKFISRETIGSSIWGLNGEIANRTIEQHIYKLRKKLLMGPERKVTLRTAYNQGYRLEILP